MVDQLQLFEEVFHHLQDHTQGSQSQPDGRVFKPQNDAFKFCGRVSSELTSQNQNVTCLCMTTMCPSLWYRYYSCDFEAKAWLLGAFWHIDAHFYVFFFAIISYSSPSNLTSYSALRLDKNQCEMTPLRHRPLSTTKDGRLSAGDNMRRTLSSSLIFIFVH